MAAPKPAPWWGRLDSQLTAVRVRVGEPRVFIAATRAGVARAIVCDPGAWTVERLLAGHTVRCLASDPLNAGVVYAGTQGEGVLRSNDWV